MENKIYTIGSSTDYVFNHFCIVASFLGVNIEVFDIPFEIIKNKNNLVEVIKQKLPAESNIFIRFFENKFKGIQEKDINCSVGYIIDIIENSGQKVIHSIQNKSTNFCKIIHLESNKTLCEKFNVKLPNTILSNNKSDLIKFILNNNGKVINKGNSNEKTTVQFIDIKDLDKTLVIPILLQEYLEGIEIRVHLVDNMYVAEEITSAVLDYRLSTQNEYKRIYLPKNIVDFCIELAKKEALIFSGIDFKYINGQYYFMEINSQPDYRGYDKRANFEITKNIIKYYST